MEIVVVRGGGDIASGTIHRLHRAGFGVIVLEIENPSAIRRKAAFCEAVFDGAVELEGVVCQRAADIEDAMAIIKSGRVALLIDENGASIEKIKPRYLVDGILAKRNCGTKMSQAEFTVALGPGFTAGRDVSCVVETMRGHNLGRLIYDGCAMANTGVPGAIAGYAKERVIHAPASGIMENIAEIGDIVKKSEAIARIGDTDVLATLNGVLRGIIRNGYAVEKGLKIADIDPRESEQKNCYTISDKARCIAGGVLEAIMAHGAGR